MKFSIVVYIDHEELLGTCLDSIRTQGMDDLEVILIGDTSSDDVREQIRLHREITGKEESLKVVHTEDMNAPEAFNCGIDLAEGTHVAFLLSSMHYKEQVIQRVERRIYRKDYDRLAAIERGEILPEDFVEENEVPSAAEEEENKAENLAEAEETDVEATAETSENVSVTSSNNDEEPDNCESESMEQDSADDGISEEFLEMGSIIPDDQIEEIPEEEIGELVCISPWTVNEKGETLRYAFSPAPSKSGVEVIRLKNSPYRVQLLLNTFFIPKNLILAKQLRFKPELNSNAYHDFVIRMLCEHKYYTFLHKCVLFYTTQLEDNTSASMEQHYEYWYLPSFRDWLLPLAEEIKQKYNGIPTFARFTIYYLIYTRYNCNYNDRNKGILKADDVSEYARYTGKLLQFIENEMIWNKNKVFNVQRTLKVLFLRLKADSNGKKADSLLFGNTLMYWPHKPFKKGSKECDIDFGRNMKVDLTKPLHAVKSISEKNNWIIYCDVPREYVILQVVNYENGKLEIDGKLSLGDFLSSKQIQLSATINKKVYKAKYSEVYGLNKVFGVSYNHRYQFHISIPVKKDGVIRFQVTLGGKTYPIGIHTEGLYSHVSHQVKNCYWSMGNGWCLMLEKSSELKLVKLDLLHRIYKEYLFRSTLKEKAEAGDTWAALALKLRKQYFRKKLFCHKRIWITFDKLYKAGDNGEYMYDYISKQKNHIDIRYMIKEDAVDYERMKNKGDKLLVWGEEKSILTALLAEAVLTTHTNVASYVGIDKGLIPYVKDLYNATNICIQHGLTTQDIAQFQNRLFDNLKLYVCASPNEIENLSRPIYGFDNKEVLKLTGVARYDGLVSNDQKQILITPTWRRNIANANVAHVKKGHNEFFKQSEYFKVYNDLINDRRLIECAKETGYKVIYLLHPAASSQIDDFDRNEYVQLIPAAGDMNYEKILTESSLMVTDYSGVQFDFAYQRKPLLYYHPKSLPPHYDQSRAYTYDQDAFGPIIDNHEDIVDALCDYMRNGCRMKEEYVERANRFFAYDDHSSCKRIYETILEFLNQRRRA